MRYCKPFKAVVFDMDGILLDTERLNCRAGQEVAAQMGVQLPESLYIQTLGRTWPDSVKIYKEYYGADFDAGYLRDQTLEAVTRHVEAHGYALMPGVSGLLDWLRARGVPMAVATSSEWGRSKLDRAGLCGYFPVVVTGDMVARSKPQPDIYLAAAAALGVPADRCVAFEDSPAGIRSAAAAGMQVVMVPDMVPADGELTALAAAVLPSLEAAPPWLEGGLEGFAPAGTHFW